VDKKFLIIFAIRNLTFRKLRVALTIVGMLIGISTIIFLVSFAFGLEGMVKDEMSNGNAAQLIDVGTGNSQIVKLNSASIDQIKQLSDVKQIERIANVAALSRTGINGKAQDISFYIVSKDYLNFSGFSIKYGEDFNQQTTEQNNILINEDVLSRLGLPDSNSVLGQEIALDLIIPKQITDGDVAKFENLKYKIIGVIKTGSISGVYLSEKDANQFPIKSYSKLKVYVNRSGQVEAVRKRIEANGLKTEYVGEATKQVEQVFNIFKIALGSFGLIALMVAGLGMLNTLTISLLERTKEVATMKLIGIKSKSIKLIFITEAITMGLFGGLCGIIFGVGLSKATNIVVNNLATRSGGDPTVLFITPIWFAFLVLMFSIVTGAVTGFYPAYRASKINPLDVMRYE